MKNKFIDNKTDWDEGIYYKIVRFKTGENILCQMDKDIKSISTEVYFHMINPVIRSVAGGTEVNGNIVSEQYILNPWIGGTSSDEFVVPVEIVLTIGDMDERQTVQYKAYWSIIAIRARLLEEKIQKDIRDTELFMMLMSISPTGEVHFLNDTIDVIATDMVPNIAPPEVKISEELNYEELNQEGIWPDM